MVIARLVRNCAQERAIQYAEPFNFLTDACGYWMRRFRGA
jgi:hypothetical protein